MGEIQTDMRRSHRTFVAVFRLLNVAASSGRRAGTRARAEVGGGAGDGGGGEFVREATIRRTVVPSSECILYLATVVEVD